MAGFGRGRTGKRGGRQGGGYAAGPGGDCVCPQCGHREPHLLGTPCYEKKCPKCGSRLVRG